MMLRKLGTALLAALALAACSDDDDNASPALVRAVHASPDAPAVDIAVDGSVALEDVTFFAASGYLEVPAGNRNVQVRVANTTTAPIDADLTLEEGQAYTVIATNFLADIEPVVLEDDLAAPAAGQVKIRAVHASPSTGNVDIYVIAPGTPLPATPTLANVPFKGFSPYLAVPAGEYRIVVTPAGNDEVLAIDATLNFTAGQIRTVLARDNEAAAAGVSAEVLSDN